MAYRSAPFNRFAKWISHSSGHPMAFGAALMIVIGWLATGPVFRFSDTWQLVINTGTTIVTFLMVFLIQNTQNRDSHAIQIKLDELIRVQKGAHIALLDLEELSDGELVKIRDHYEELARRAREAIRSGGSDTGIPRVRLDWETGETGPEGDGEEEESAGKG
jgi:low affinity Fe/Cu permease